MANDIGVLGRHALSVEVWCIVNLQVNASEILAFPPYIDWATSLTGLDIREQHWGLRKDFLEFEGRELPSYDLSLTVPRYMNQKAFHINTVQEMIHVSRLPFFYPLVYMELFRIIL
jgi:hypothetical protein